MTKDELVTRELMLTAVLLAAGYVHDVNAETISCDGCTPAEMRKLAMVAAASNENQSSDVYVTNRESGKVHLYSVTRDPSAQSAPEQPPHGSLHHGLVVENAVPATVADYFSTAMRIDGETYVIPIGNGLPDSMYAIVNNPSKEHALLESVKSAPKSELNALAMHAQIAAGIPAFDPSEVHVAMTLEAEDGSSADFVFDPKTTLWHRQKNSTRDSNKNIIPASQSELTGGTGSFRQYTFDSPETQARFVRQATKLGATFASTATSGGSMVCTSTTKAADEGDARRTPPVCSAD